MAAMGAFESFNSKRNERDAMREFLHGGRAQVRFCRYRFSSYRRLRIQRDQGRGGLGYRFTV